MDDLHLAQAGKSGFYLLMHSVQISRSSPHTIFLYKRSVVHVDTKIIPTQLRDSHSATICWPPYILCRSCICLLTDSICGTRPHSQIVFMVKNLNSQIALAVQNPELKVGAATAIHPALSERIHALQNARMGAWAQRLGN